jgi:hypothetical protein
MYDKWQIQKRFVTIASTPHEPLTLALREIDRLLYIRERLLLDYPDRQDIDLRDPPTVRRVWRFLRQCQARGEDVAKFSCARVERDLGWELDEDGDWDAVSAYLLEQGNEGRIFIDPRTYYDSHSWIVEDFPGKTISPHALEHFYAQFTTYNPSYARETLECGKCSDADECGGCEDVCLLCLPAVETVAPISPLSSLPSPPRTPGTQSLPSYFKGRRLVHPPVREEVVEYTDDEAVDILLSFSGVAPRKRRKGRD